MSAQKIYPAKRRLQFDGGLNNKFDRALILENESPDCANVRFVNGSVETREGVSQLNTTAVGTFVCDGLYTRHATDASETMVAWFGGTMWRLGTTTFTTIGSAQSIYTAGQRVCSAEYEGHRFFCNGGTIPYKYNGVAFTRHGVYPPTTTMTAGTAPTGVGLTGGFQYKVTFVNSQSVESDVGPLTATFTAANENIRLTSIPVAAQSWGVSSRRIYRTENGGATFKRVVEIADNSTTTYDDAIADAALGATAPTDNGVPPKYSTIVYHQNRLFCNDTGNYNYLWYSDLAEPYTFGSTNFIQIGDNTSDLIRSLHVHADSILVECDRSHWLIYMPSTDPTEWNVVRVRSPHGSKSPFGVFSYDNKTMFPAIQNDKFVGFAAIEGVDVSPQSTFLTIGTAGSQLKSDPIETSMFAVQTAYLGNISSIVYKNRAYISVTHGSGNTTNNRVWIYDFSIENLTKRQKAAWSPDTGINAAQFTIYGGNLYYGSSTANGLVYRYENGTYSDNGSAIDSYYWTKELGGGEGDFNMFKDWRYLSLLVENSGAWDMSVYHRVDSDKGGGDLQELNLDPGSSLWGTFVWGRDPWGGGTNEKEVRLFLSGARGKRIQFKFSNQNTVGQKFKVIGLNVAYNVKGYR